MPDEINEKHLQKFCREILLAIKGRAVPYWFNESGALCLNAIRYDFQNDSSIHDYMSILFDGNPYPFNDSGPAGYRVERDRLEFYLNKKRIAFLEKYANPA